jgi:Zinc finger, C2H2 type
MDLPQLAMALASTSTSTISKAEAEELFCRCCLATSTETEDLFDMKIVAFDYQETQTTTYFSAYLEASGCCPNRLAEISGDSYMICQKCANQLEVAFAFRAQCSSVMAELERQFAEKQQQSGQPATEDLLLDIEIKEETEEVDVLVLSDDDDDQQQLLVPMMDAPIKLLPTPVIDYRCNKCPKKFRLEHNFRQHFNEAHRQPKSKLNKAVYKCEPCYLSFSRSSSLAKHIDTKHLAAGYPCNECDQVFNAESSLSFHKQVNHKRIRFECPVCHKQFTHGPNLWSHSFVHQCRSKLPFKCRECHFDTANHTYFKLHLKTQHNTLYDETVYGHHQATRKAVKAMINECRVTI